MRTNLPVLAGACLLAGSAFGYTQMVDSLAVKMSRPDPTNVVFQVDPSVVAGLTNTLGYAIISSDTDPIDTIRRSMATWNNVPGTTAHFGDLVIAPISTTTANSIEFSTDPYTSSVVGSAIAVTMCTEASYPGAIAGCSITMSPDFLFSSTHRAGSMDLQSILTHELGHTLGVGHTWLQTATMYPISDFENYFARTLSSDDIAAVQGIYPAAGAPSGFITGTVTLDTRKPAAYAWVNAVNARDWSVVGGFAGTNGGYQIGPLPSGDYYVYAEADNGIVQPWELGAFNPSSIVGGFQTTVLGGAASPTTVHLDGGGRASAPLTVASSAVLGIDLVEVAVPPPAGGRVYAAQMPTGVPLSFTIYAADIDNSMGPGNILFWAPGVTIRPGTFSVTPPSDPTMDGYVSFVADVDPLTDWGNLTILLRNGNLIAVHDATRTMPAAPFFRASDLVNAASSSYDSGVAPGEIASIYGAGIGPLNGLNAGALTGNPPMLAAALGNVQVLFDGVPAPLFYVGPWQINVQVPYQVAGEALSSVEVRYNGASSSPIPIDVVANDPHAFVVVNNDDGGVNSQNDPARPNRTIIVYGTGPGVVDPAVPTGEAGPFGPLSMVDNVTATINNLPARVDYAGLAPGLVGLFQLNVDVPPTDGLRTGVLDIGLKIGSYSNPHFGLVWVTTSQ